MIVPLLLSLLLSGLSSEASVMELRASLLSPPLPFSYAADLSILFFPFSLQGTTSISERKWSALFVCRCRHLSYLVCTRTSNRFIVDVKSRTRIHRHPQSKAVYLYHPRLYSTVLKEYFAQKKENSVIFYSPSTRYDVLFFPQNSKVEHLFPCNYTEP